MAAMMADWRLEPPSRDRMLAVEDSLTAFVLGALSDISAALDLDLEAGAASLLGRNHPNPFAASTVLSYELPHAAPVRLAVYDPQGRLVAELVRAWQGRGRYSVSWDASGQASGVYLFRLRVGDEQFARKGFHLR
jgi:hypothetical protein